MKMTMNDMETELTELLEKCDGTSGTEILKNLTEWMTLENSIRMDSDRQEIDMVAIVSKVIEFTLKEFNKRLPEWQNSSKSMDMLKAIDDKVIDATLNSVINVTGWELNDTSKMDLRQLFVNGLNEELDRRQLHYRIEEINDIERIVEDQIGVWIRNEMKNNRMKMNEEWSTESVEQFILEIYGRVQDQIKAQHSSVVLNEDDVIGLLYDCGFGEYYEASISDDN